VDARALLITGTVGSGKTSVADALGDLLSGAGIPNAVIDIDGLRRAWPSPPDDPFQVELALRNLRAVARNEETAAAVAAAAGWPLGRS
jgi:adenylylsulfate kinase-like enzyme